MQLPQNVEKVDLPSFLSSVPSLVVLVSTSLDEESPASLGLLLSRKGRNRFLSEMERRGLSRGQRSALADALMRAIDSGVLPRDDGQICHEFRGIIERMPAAVHSLLVRNCDPAAVPVDVLLGALGRTDQASREACEGDVMLIERALSPK